MTYREIIYMVNDLCKQLSDDTILNEDHILFLLNKYRGTLLYQYTKQKMLVPHENYLTIKITITPINNLNMYKPDDGALYVSNEELPNLMSIGNPSVYTPHWFINSHEGIYNGYINLISRERMRYVGYGRLTNEIYCSIAPDHKMYFKIHNSRVNNEDFPDLAYEGLTEIHITGVFEDAIAASKFESTDVYDLQFPLDSSLLPNLLQAVLKDILGAAYRPKDGANDANDDMANLAYFIQKNVKSALAKQLDANE